MPTDDPHARRLENLTEALVTMAATAERQREILGYGDLEEEIVNDFEAAYTLERKTFVAHHVLSSRQLQALDRLDQYLDEMSEDEAFWRQPGALSRHPSWDRIRRLAHACLVELGRDHLDIAVEHTVEHTKAPDGTPLIVQHTRTRLVPRQDEQDQDSPN